MEKQYDKKSENTISKKQSEKSKKLKEKPKTDKKIIEMLKQQIKNEKNNYLIALADLENDRKRFEKSKHDFIKFTNVKVLEELITILDSFNIAMNIKKPSLEVKNFLSGFKMIENQFKNLLENNGITKLETKLGDEFNSESHFLIEEIESQEFKSGQIVQIIKEGYKIHDRLLRPAMVKTVKLKDKKSKK